MGEKILVTMTQGASAEDISDAIGEFLEGIEEDGDEE